eukprot:TRINITY_DN1072_c0_g1_i1.p1 TRINITY_DN1072_c0_g1~~TRINITY_DN1072_c0_g1_i1.p1  ORF type:complete len:142 (-),score=46.89 TRINITY_DN1072_c0_g1_i1:91-471(-)
MLRSLVGSEMCIRDRLRTIYTINARVLVLRTTVMVPPAPKYLDRFERVLGGLVDVGLGDLSGGGTTSGGDVGDLLGDAIGPVGGEDDLELHSCLLYTSDAADEEDSVDLGGRRIIKKKKKKRKYEV